MSLQLNPNFDCNHALLFVITLPFLPPLSSVKCNPMKEDVPPYAMGSGNYVIIVNQTSATVETTLVHKPRDPRVSVRYGRTSTDNSILLVR